MKVGILILIIFILTSCNKTVSTPHEVTGTLFPKVNGTSLSGEARIIPDDYRGRYVIVLVGYLQDAQFDIDRWILGLLQLGIKTEIIELPAIAGMMPRAVQGYIDDGMRSGIPSEDWGTLITIYEDADKIINSFGNEKAKNANVFLLNKSGEVIWFTNRGYSASQVLSLKEKLTVQP